VSATRTTPLVNRVRLVCLSSALAWLAFATGSRVSSQGALTIGGYQLVSEQTQKNSQIIATYRATLTNGTSGALASATATLKMIAGSAKVVDGTLVFGPVGAGASVLSADTFSISRNANGKFDVSTLAWTITSTPNRAPVANAGANFTRHVGETAQLDGSGSTDQDGNPLTFSWSFVSRPVGSLAALSSPTAVKPDFVVDQPGSYVVQLVVNDGFVNSTPARVTVTTVNSAPVANAGPDQTVFVQQTVTLDGSRSSDVDGNTLTFSWTFVSRPAGSAAALTNPTSATPTLVVDQPGTYVVQLIVNDGLLNSAPDTVSITTQNSLPVANAGSDQSVFVTQIVTLDGSQSSDVDGDRLTYAWAFTSIPALSGARLSDPTAIRPTFVVDRPGTYVAQLIVDDGHVSGAPDTVTITTENTAPVAKAGPDQTAVAGALVLLDGTASSDVDYDPLTYRWSFTTVPSGSAATLTGASTAGPSFIVDRPGAFVVQLIVNDGQVDGAPDTVVINTTNTTPVADAGPDQLHAPVGATVTLDGARSHDADPSQVLTYSWSLLARPATSAAALGGANAANPTFTPDVAGDYVAQLIVNDGFQDSAPDTVFVHANSPPIANAGPDQQVTVGAVVSLDGSGSRDPDGSALSFAWQLLAAPAGSAAALQNPTTASPTFTADVVGDYQVQLTVTDSDGAVADDSVIITALPVAATMPSITLNPTDVSVLAGSSATFSASATSNPAPTVQWQVSTDSGATFVDVPGATSPVLGFIAQPSDDTKRYRAVFTNIAGSAATTAAILTVTINAIGEPITFTDSVSVNAVPLLAPLADRTVDALALVQFTAIATDPSDTLTFALIGAPIGAVINTATGVFSWTPTAAQAGTYSFGVRVTDSGGLWAQRPVTITVRPVVNAFTEAIQFTDSVVVNARPLLAALQNQTVDALTLVQFTAIATDPGDTLTFSLSGAPAAAAINATTGAFSWTPAVAQAGAAYSFTVVVTDSGGLSATQPFTIMVRQYASTVDEPVTVDDAIDINGQPMLGALANQTVDANALLQFTATATDPGDTLAFGLLNGPAGATLVPQPGGTSALFSWTPTVAQSGSAYSFTIVVTDSGGLSAAQLVTITVRPYASPVDEPVTVDDDIDINGEPMLGPLADEIAHPARPLTFTATAVDPGDTLTFTLRTAPSGAAIDPVTGEFSWTPTLAQSPGVYPVVVRVTDHGGLFAERGFSITVTNAGPTVTIDQAIAQADPTLADPIAFSVTFSAPVTGFTAAGVSLAGSTAAGVLTASVTGSGASYTVLVSGMTGNGFVVASIPAGAATDAAGDPSAASTSADNVVSFFASVVAPVVLTQPTDQTVNVGDPATFLALASGDPPPAVQWQSSTDGGATFVDVPGATFPAVTFATTLDDNGKTYRVVFTNLAGSIATAPAALTVRLVVTNTNDAGAGSLRDAILLANAHTGVTETVTFNIPSLGPQTIAPTTPLPPITDPVIIDGTTQPGYTSSQPVIEIEGTLAGSDANGLIVAAGHSTIRGVVINRFGAGGTGAGGTGIVLLGGGHNTIDASFIGTDRTGSSALPNRGDGILIDTTSDNVITANNIIAFNGAAGVSISGSGNTVESNRIFANTAAGVLVLSGSGNTISANAIFDNGRLGIDLVAAGGATADGVTPNDAGDADTGANDLQNSPVLTSALSDAGATTILGTLNSTPNTQFRIQFYWSATCDASGYGQGGTHLGVASTATDGNGDASFTFTFGFEIPTGQAITATAAPLTGGTSEFSKCLPVNTTVGLTPATLNLLTRDAGTLTVVLSDPAGVNGATVGVASTNSSVADVPASVTIQPGATSATVNVTSGTTAGTATITATAPGFSAVAPSDVTVSSRTMTLSSPNSLVGVGRTIGGAITLAQPAPAGGVTIALSSSNDAVVTVQPATVTIAQGGLTASFTIAGVSGGPVTLSAAASGFATATLPITATTTTLITLGSGSVAPGLDTSLALSIGIAAPAGGVTIALTSSDPSIAAVVTPTMFIPEGLQIAAANPVVHGVAIGAAQITASAVGLAPDTAPVSVTVSIAFSPGQLTVVEGQTINATLTVSSPAPPGGLTFTTTSINPAIATVPGSAHIDAGTTSIQVAVTGVVIGTTSVRASAPGITDATIGVTVIAAPPINIAGATIGKDLQAMLGGTLSAAAPAGNLQVTMTSLDPTKLLLATSDSAAGAASITVQVDAGQTVIPSFFAQALAGAGSVQVRTTAPGYAAGTTTIALVPSGFSFGIGTGDITTSTFSGNTTVSVIAAQLNPADLTVVTPQPLRGGLSVDVPISSSDPAIGRIVDSHNNQIVIDHLAFNGSDSFMTAAFDPRQGGTITITVGTPAGFSTPTQLQHITATISAPPINMANTIVGQNLQVLLGGTLGASAPAGNAQVTVTSLDPAKVVLSTDGATAGAASVTFEVGAGQTAIPQFYVQALAGTGTAQLRTSANGYTAVTSTVTLTPSGFSFAPGTGDITTTSFSTNTLMNVVPVRLNAADLKVAGAQAIRGGGSARVAIGSSDATVGVLVDSANNQLPVSFVDFANGDTNATVAFDPIGGGTTTIGLTTPTGFSTPSELQHITATVSAPPINMAGTTIGKDLQTSLSGSLGAPAPAGNVQVMIASQDPSKVLLATGPAAAGVTSLTFTVAAGSSGIPLFYVQALTGTGTVQIRTTAPGYSAAVSTITLTPSGFTYPLGTGDFTTTTFSGNRTLSVVPMRLDPVTLAAVTAQTLRPGLADMIVPVTSSDANVGTIVDGQGTPISGVTFKSGDSSQPFAFNPLAGGTSTISLAAASGFSLPSTSRSITATVTAPNVNVSAATMQVGLDLQAGVTITLGATPPSRLNVTVTSNSDTIATVTTDPLVAGGSSVTFNNVPTILPGTAVGAFYVQGRSLGSTTITVRAPGYNDATINVTVHPSGFSFAIGSGSTLTTTTFSPNSTFSIEPVRLDPTTLNVAGAQTLRGGYPDVSVTVTSSNTTVGTIVNSPAVLKSNETFKSVQFDPANAGSTTISVSTPAGFSTPSNLQQILATVTAPNVNFSSAAVSVGLDLQVAVVVSLAVVPPSLRDVTVTSSNTAIATITSDPKVAGGATVTFPNAPASGTTAGTIYVQGRALGVTTITAHAAGYNDATMTVTVTPSGFSFSTGSPASITTTTFSGNTQLSVVPARLDPTTLNVVAQQALRGGYPDVSVTVSSSDTAVGTIVNSPAVFSSNDTFKSIQFDPATAGTATISLSTPAGFTTPSNLKQIPATVTAPNLTFNTGSAFVGVDLQIPVNVSFAVSPPTRRDVTVTVNDGSIAVVSTDPVVAGTSALTLTNVPTTLPGTLAGTIYVQGLVRGTTTITVHAAGYNDATMSVTVHPSGFAFTLGTVSFTTTTTSANRTLTVVPVRLDPVFLNVAAQQALRGGHGDVSVAVTSSSTAVGTMVNSPALFHAGDSSKTVQFDPATVGTTTIAVTTAPGFSMSSNLQQIVATVNP
jgi:parallel beta-helix repeat protein